MKKINLIGQKFGKLTVLSEVPERKNKQIYWHCKCDCGNEVDIAGKRLRNNTTKSCGCLRKEKAREVNFKDFTGQKFGLLTVINLKEFNNGVSIWHCKCDCGNEIDISSSNLRKTKSCGCSRIKDLTGEKFGLLTVIKPTKERKNGFVVWECECECGRVTTVTSNHLTQGQVSSCGCLSISRGELEISKILKLKNIKFETQKTFDSCRFLDTNALAKFDFYLPEYNILIEFDGKQHFNYDSSGWNTKENFKKIKERDNYKNEWCRDNNISLIRIPYWDLDNIENIITQEIKDV